MPRSLPFLLAASTHSNFELRAFAAEVLKVLSTTLTVEPAVSAKGPRGVELLLREVVRVLREDTLKEGERERALGVASPLLHAGCFVLESRCTELNTIDEIGPFNELRRLVEASLGHREHKVRAAAKRVIANSLASDAEKVVIEHVDRHKAMAGKAPKRGEHPIDVSESVIAGVVGLSCAMLAAADCGVPSWTGQVIESIAPYGRPAAGAVIHKEVQTTLQAFLKVQQANRQTWLECKTKLSSAQIDLLNESKGSQSYFS